MSTPRATETFLQSFNSIDARLRKLCNVGRQVPFTRVLRLAQEKDPTLVRIADQMELFSQLRNVIVHNGTHLAEPLKATVKAIGDIRKHLETPVRLGAAFVRGPVTCRPADPIRRVAKLMATKDFSQLPVYNDSGLLLGMITTAAVARWLGAHADRAGADLDTPVSEVRAHEEYPHAYLVFRKDETAGKALAAFKQRSDQGQPLYAIVLTDDGRHNSPPCGLITLFDVPRLWGLAVGG
jgi:CBS domain-containing protein